MESLHEAKEPHCPMGHELHRILYTIRRDRAMPSSLGSTKTLLRH